MKTKMVIAIAAFMVFGLSIAVVAYARTTGATSTTMSCCKGESCPLKTTKASSSEKSSCCDDCNCCSGNSCPMKTKSEATASVSKMADRESCPMMKMDKASVAVHTDVKQEPAAKSCDCSCCNHDKEKKGTVGV